VKTLLALVFTSSLVAQIPATTFGLTVGSEVIGPSPTVPYPSIPFGYGRIFGGLKGQWSAIQVACVAPIATTPSNFNFGNLNTWISNEIAHDVGLIEIPVTYTPNCVNGATGPDTTCSGGGVSNPIGFCRPPSDLTSSGSPMLRSYLTALIANLQTHFPTYFGFHGSGWNEINAGSTAPNALWFPGTTTSPQNGYSTGGLQMLTWMQKDICDYFNAAGYTCGSANTADMESSASATILGNLAAQEIAIYGHVISGSFNYHAYTNASPGFNLPETSWTIEGANARAALIAVGVPNPVFRVSEGSWLRNLYTTWNSGTTYAKGQLVGDGTTCYVAIAASTNSAPPSANWTTTSCTDADLSAAFLARWFLPQISPSRILSIMWFSYDLLDGQLYPSGGPPSATASVYQNLASLTTGIIPSNPQFCSVSGTQWTCSGVKNGVTMQWVWDSNNYCSNGICTTTSFAVTPGAWSEMRDYLGNATALSSATSSINVGLKPMLLIAGYSGSVQVGPFVRKGPSVKR
jgi:hypothetical protein